MTDNRDRDDLSTWLHDRIEPLSPPRGTFEAIQRRARRRKLRKLAVSAGAAAVVIAAALTVPRAVNLRVEPARQEAGASPATTTANNTTSSGPGIVDAPSGLPIPLPHGNPVPPNFQPTSITAVSAQTMFVIGQAGTPGQCATQYCTSVARTQDDGSTWSGLPAPLTGAPDGATGVGQIRFLEGINGWAFGPELWATHDGGEKWTRIGTHGMRIIDVETVGKRAYAIEANCTGTGADYAAGCTNFTLYETPAAANHWTPTGASTTSLNKQGAVGSAALVLTGSKGYLLGPDGALYSGPVTGAKPWPETGQIPCPAGLAQQDGTPAGAMLGALTAQDLILSCGTKAIYQSADGGTTWRQTTAGPGASAGTSTSIAASPAAAVILGTTLGIEVLPAGGSTWRPATLARTAPQGGFGFVGMTTPTRGIALPANAQDGTVWFTKDGGLSWAPSQVQSQTP
jgi:photosystem II stability/assembly factor-like uncharacterized protein